MGGIVVFLGGPLQKNCTSSLGSSTATRREMVADIFLFLMCVILILFRTFFVGQNLLGSLKVDCCSVTVFLQKME
jgi:hypothetical protein